MPSLLTALADLGRPLVAVIVLVYLGLIVVLSLTATFASLARRQAAFRVLSLLWVRPRTRKKPR